MHILYLVPHVPNPTKVRSYFHIRGLREAGHSITVVTLQRSPADIEHIRRLRESGVSVLSAPLTKRRLVYNALRQLPTQLPLQAKLLWSNDLMRQIEDDVRENPPDVVHVEHLRMAAYGLRLLPHWPVVWDAVDCLAPLYRQAQSHSTSGLLRAVAVLEAPRLEQYERWLTGKFPLTLVISPNDQTLFQQHNPNASRIQVAAIGVPVPPLLAAAERSENTLIITGTLNYHPNVAAVYHFVKDIFPLVQREKSGVCLQLVGANPDARMLALQNSAVEVTGFVPSLTDYLRRATIALAPVTYGSGTQIKVLEAFLTATPLVATSVALRGLDVCHEEQILIADRPDAFAKAVLRLLDDPALRERIGQAGRHYLETYHRLDRTTARLLELYQTVIKASRQ